MSQTGGPAFFSRVFSQGKKTLKSANHTKKHHIFEEKNRAERSQFFSWLLFVLDQQHMLGERSTVDFYMNRVVSLVTIENCLWFSMTFGPCYLLISSVTISCNQFTEGFKHWALRPLFICLYFALKCYHSWSRKLPRYGSSRDCLCFWVDIKQLAAARFFINQLVICDCNRWLLPIVSLCLFDVSVARWLLLKDGSPRRHVPTVILRKLNEQICRICS